MGFVITEMKLKLVGLISFLRLQSFSSPEHCKVVVFVLTTDMVEFFHTLFDTTKFTHKDEEGDQFVEDLFGVPLFKLHGNMSQRERTQMFTCFRASSSGILLCTDVAARGLDVPNIQWIVQYDAPTETKEYVHRIGRTARCTGTGKSILFLTPSEKGYVKQLEEVQLQLREVQLDVLFSTLQIPLTSGKRKPPQIRLQE